MSFARFSASRRCASERSGAAPGVVFGGDSAGGMGGIQTGRHALDFLRAGAACVAVGTESFRDPAAGARIGAELRALTGAAAGEAAPAH
jgi:hypothetical protein